MLNSLPHQGLRRAAPRASEGRQGRHRAGGQTRNRPRDALYRVFPRSATPCLQSRGPHWWAPSCFPSEGEDG